MAISSVKKQEVIKLDLHDKKILRELSINLRIPRKQLAKKIGISQERVHYKIKRLTKELIEPAIILNYSLLGIHQYIILLENLDGESLKKLLDEAPIWSLIQTLGRYQYVLYVLTDDVDPFCKEFLPNQYFEIFPITRDMPDFYNPFNLKTSPLQLKKDKKISLDKKDYSILYYLSKNPLESVIKLSEKTKCDKKTINLRIKKMLDTNVIKLFRYGINIFRLGVSTYFLKINTTPDNKQKILSAIRSDNFSGFVYETYTGFFMWYMPPSHKELFNFTKDLELIDKSIKIDAMQSAEILKLETVPKKVLEIFKERAKIK